METELPPCRMGGEWVGHLIFLLYAYLQRSDQSPFSLFLEEDRI